MNETTMNMRPVLCLVNLEPYGDAASKLGLDCRTVSLQTDRIPELPERFDALNPDCVLIGNPVPSATAKEGYSVWAEIADYCEARYIPIIAVAEEPPPELALFADAFLRPSDETGLRVQLLKLIGRRERILDQILIDPMTGVYRSRYLRREVELQLSDLKRSHEMFSLVYLDVDPSVSSPNSRRTATQGLIDLIQKSIRPTDRLALHSEGGFVLVLPKTAKEDALKLMNRLTRSFAALTFDTPEGELRATFSAKVREFVQSGMTADECLALMPFADEEPIRRNGLVLDASDDLNSQVRKLMVAVIDDDRLIRELLKHQLADIGDERFEVEIRTFADGEQFFNDPWHRQNERFLVIIDRIMPKMDGLEVLTRIRDGYDRRKYLCVMVSSKGAETDIAMAIQRGANDYVVKPFSLKELRARISRLIGGLR